jgi:hypothetical protein
MDLIIKKYCKKNDLLVWDKFIINDSLNGTIYHTRNFLSYHENRFIDNSIMIYDKKKLIAVFPCCKINQEYYSHRGSTCGGIVILEKYYELIKLTNIMDAIYSYYNANLHIKLSESIYFKNNKSNELLNFVLSKKCSNNKDISLYFDVNTNEKIIDSFPKSRNKDYLKKYIKNENNNINFQISDKIEDYKNYYILLDKFLREKNNVTPLHSLDEFILLKKILAEKQFLFLSKNKNNIILSGAWVFYINKKIIYTPYLMTNYDEENTSLVYLLYELFQFAKKNNISIVNLGACSTGGGKNILYSKYKFKNKCGCLSNLKFNFEYKNL